MCRKKSWCSRKESWKQWDWVTGSGNGVENEERREKWTKWKCIMYQVHVSLQNQQETYSTWISSFHLFRQSSWVVWFHAYQRIQNLSLRTSEFHLSNLYPKDIINLPQWILWFVFFSRFSSLFLDELLGRSYQWRRRQLK